MLNVVLHNINRLHRLFEKATGVGKKKKIYTVQTIKETAESKC